MNGVVTFMEKLTKQLIIDNFIKNKKSILDKGFGLADIMLISCLDWAIYYEFKLPDRLSKRQC